MKRDVCKTCRRLFCLHATVMQTREVWPKRLEWSWFGFRRRRCWTTTWVTGSMTWEAGSASCCCCCQVFRASAGNSSTSCTPPNSSASSPSIVSCRKCCLEVDCVVRFVYSTTDSCTGVPCVQLRTKNRNKSTKIVEEVNITNCVDIRHRPKHADTPSKIAPSQLLSRYVCT